MVEWASLRVLKTRNDGAMIYLLLGQVTSISFSSISLMVLWHLISFLLAVHLNRLNQTGFHIIIILVLAPQMYSLHHELNYIVSDLSLRTALKCRFSTWHSRKIYWGYSEILLSLQRNSKAPWKLGGMKSIKIKDKGKKSKIDWLVTLLNNLWLCHWAL